MITQPGVVIRQYLGGQRKRYVNPFSYVVLCGLFYAVVAALLDGAGAPARSITTADATEAIGALGDVEDQYSALTYTAVAAVGVTAPVLWLLFDSQLLNLTEALVTALFVAGNALLGGRCRSQSESLQ